jgi:hypothetical protein
MIRPVGPKGGNGEFPVTKIPPGAAEVSDVAQARLAKPVIGKPVDFKKRSVQMSPQDPTTEKTEDKIFNILEDINEANAKP